MRSAKHVVHAVALAVAILCLGAPPAVAEPELELTMARTAAPLTHDDERLAYQLEVANTASAKPGVGDELTCNPIKWSGNPAPAIEVEWLRSGVPITGTTEPMTGPSTYAIVPADVGKALQCQLTGANEPAGGGVVHVSSTVSQPPVWVQPEPVPAPPVPPDPASRVKFALQTGDAEAGGTPTCEAPAGWTGDALEWSFEWLVNGEPGAGTVVDETPTTSEYEIAAADVPGNLQCRATVKDAAGNEARAFSGILRLEPQPPAPYVSVATGSNPQISFANQTSGPVTVDVELPHSAETFAIRVFSGPGAPWSCSKLPPSESKGATATCTREDVLQPQDSYPLINVVAHVGNDAPDLLVTKAFLEGGGSGPDAAEDSVTVGPAIPFRFEAFKTAILDENGNDYTQAGGHPFSAGAELEFSKHDAAEAPQPFLPNGRVRTVRTDTPRGFVGNPQAITERCAEIADVIAKPTTSCPEGSVVGGITLETNESKFLNKPIYILEPEFGVPAAFGFGIANLSLAFVLTPELRAEDGYAISLVSAPATKGAGVIGAEIDLCGFGAKPLGISPQTGESEFKGCRKASEPGALEKPLITNPTRCSGEAPTTRIYADSWEDPGNFAEASWTSPALTGCENVDFEPSISLTPTSKRADSPTGMEVELTMPTAGLESNEGIAQANLANSTVTLPEGMSVNAAAGQGLGACTQAQLGMSGGVPNDEPANCPESSKVGTVEVDTPLIEETLHGSVYVAKQQDNPFGSLLALYLVLESPRYGITIKIAGKVTPDPVSGRLTASFEENPEAPFSRLALKFQSGDRAALVNPPACGSYQVTSELSPWSAADPANPTPEETVVINSPFKVTQGPGGGPCPTGALEPKLKAGMTNPLAGATSPFTLRLSREDGTQRFKELSATMPPGLTAYLKGIPYCPDSVLASIPTAEGTGQAEIDSPSCPAASKLGTVTAGAGAGPTPLYISTGRAYLAGPYKGAPLSLAIVTPAVAGPFDLGNVVLRTALQLNPETAIITAVSDPIPTILKGIPLNVRDVRVEIDRPDFTLAPTNCEAKSISALVGGERGASAQASYPFQARACSKLGFKPKLKLRLLGGTKRGAYQRLEATLKARPGDANISRAAVTLPRSAFLAQEHIRTICTRVQFAADACPPGSIYGSATATSPLLDYPLQGTVYLRSSSNPLPDMVVALKGPAHQPLEIAVAGRVDSKNGGIRNTFELVPDAPVSSFTLKLRGGKKSLIVNSRNLCKGTQRATVRLNAHNGLRRNFRPAVRNDCGGKAKPKPGKGKGGRG